MSINRNPRNHQLLSQIEKNPFKKTVAAAFDIPDFLARDMEAVRLDRRLSEEGKKEKKQGHLRKALRELRDLQKPLDEFHSVTEAMRGKVKRPAYDKIDYVAALNRKELRDASRAMSFGQRSMRMTGPTRSKAFIDAILEFEDDPWVSGINIDNPNERELYEAAKESRLRDFHAQLLDQIAERESVEREARMIPTVVLNDIQSDSGLGRDAFEAEATAIESGVNAHWLKRDKDSAGNEVIYVLVPEGGGFRGRIASPEEVRDGHFFQNHEEYLASRAA